MSRWLKHILVVRGDCIDPDAVLSKLQARLPEFNPNVKLVEDLGEETKDSEEETSKEEAALLTALYDMIQDILQHVML